MLDDRVRKRVLKLVHDPEFVAAKKSAAQRATKVQSRTVQKGEAQLPAVCSCLACSQTEVCPPIPSSPILTEVTVLPW